MAVVPTMDMRGAAMPPRMLLPMATSVTVGDDPAAAADLQVGGIDP
ncbi:hypothetical protein [Sinorhizobium meliloti]|nr:hypothetical protein [Sinorhizobium meliloti]UFX12954.1 hypothetical protein SmelRRI128_33055 [Sinorhizobium meliloti]